MLVLSRKKNQSIMIGDQVELKILSVEGDQVKIGIVAPKSVKVHRTEVFEAIKAQNEKSLTISLDVLDQLNFKKND
ncbi:carbon storage regulator [Lysinibacillus alkalisoli]|uniref:Translational regulator CsrA n=1 Tax=Lysinibacillus alkalisoli TaxID=1911548 RepID=A0A917D8T7_9BACI|nr:carbon storage regulator CsrA [Lysinibacillus alkalisoli]GGG13226.1 carbon storage regulator [Lysinibacillus alkalisoli]